MADVTDRSGYIPLHQNSVDNGRLEKACQLHVVVQSKQRKGNSKNGARAVRVESLPTQEFIRNRPRLATGDSTRLQRDSVSTGDASLKQRMKRIESAAELDAVSMDHGDWSLERALTQLLGHLIIDPDGGIGNLKDENVLSEGFQVSKMTVFEQDLSKAWSSKRFLAFMIIVRCIINVPAFITSASSTTYCYLSKSCAVHLVEEHHGLAKQIKLPIAEVDLSVAVVELVLGLWIIFRALFNGYNFFVSPIASDDAESSESQSIYLSWNKYSFLVDLFWDNILRLQNFSALQALSCVHPGVVNNEMKDSEQATNYASLGLLRRYLQIQPTKYLTEEEIKELAVIRLMHLEEHVHCSHIEKEERMHTYLSMSPYEIVTEISVHEDQRRSSSNTELLENGTYQGDHRNECDALVLQWIWRIHALSWFEFLWFCFSTLLFFVFGAAAFTTKLVEVAVVLFDPDVGEMQTLLSILIFLNQVMGIMAVNNLLRGRIMRFIFGGNDASLGDEERLLMSVYEAKLVEAIWTSHKLSYHQKILVLVTFDDDDLQKLLVEEDDKAKSLKVAPLWNALSNHYQSGGMRVSHKLLRNCGYQWVNVKTAQNQ